MIQIKRPNIEIIKKLPWEKYRLAMMELALQFQDMVADILFEKHGIYISYYVSKLGQYNVGESRNGYEVKFDMLLKQTNNLYIEYAEKSNPTNYNYVSSGILRDNNTKFWIQGDEKIVFIFDINILRKALKNTLFKHKQTSTSKGYLLSRSQAYERAVEVIQIYNFGDVTITKANKNGLLKDTNGK